MGNDGPAGMPGDRLTWQDYSKLSHLLLEGATKASPKVNFLGDVLRILREYTGYADVSLWLKNGEVYRCSAAIDSDRHSPHTEARISYSSQSNPKAAEILLDLMRTRPSVPSGNFSENGSFWTNQAGRLRSDSGRVEGIDILLESTGPGRRSIALIPVELAEDEPGILQLGDGEPNRFTPEVIHFFEDISRIIRKAYLNWRNSWTLQERVKEMSCLYGIAKVFDSPEKHLGEVFQEILELIPPAWLYADIAYARITFEDRCYATPGFPKDGPKQAADLVVNGERRGLVEVAYAREKPELDEGPFLEEERELLNTISRELSAIIARKLHEKEKNEIMEQLKQADRLSMMGQLAAAVAHEINEPLTSILGFAQLAKKGADLPEATSADLDKIVGVSLHAREIVRKLLMYTRKMPAREAAVDLNEVVRDALSFFEYRCAREGILFNLDFTEDLPRIEADPGHLRQVIVNLVVNAMQSMPDGGRLTVRTLKTEGCIEFAVEDTGCGMSEEVAGKIFIPFFTTKPAGRGTGLGLPVARDIVASLGGAILVDSRQGVGTTIRVRLSEDRTKSESSPSMRK